MLFLKPALPLATIFALLFTLLPTPLLAAANPKAQGEDAPYIAYHAGTGQARFVRFAPGQPHQVVAAAEQSATEIAYSFLDQYGAAFGLQNPRRDLAAQRTTIQHDGRSVTRFQQSYAQIPVIGGELVIHNRGGLVLSANGELAPEQPVDVIPRISAQAARATVLESAAKQAQIDVRELTTTEPELWIYNPVLLNDHAPNVNQLVWRITVRDETRARVNEWVLVDAHRGFVLFRAPLRMTYKNRVVYDHQNDTTQGLPGLTPIRAEGQPATGVADVDLVYEYMGDFYDFLQTTFGWDSYDNAGAQMVGVVRTCISEDCPYTNAFWDGQQLVFGAGLAAADDIVGHELSHALIERTANLFYAYQSGAINESLADVFGEFIDQTNGAGTDTAAVKWQLGEDATGGALRNMADPTIFDDPDRKQSVNYTCAESDLGGVHTNSGVNNKAAFLLAEGGSFNGHTITGIGLSKTAKLYFEVLTNHLTSSSGYADLADALIQASQSLNLSAAEQKSVEDVVDAVEMFGAQCNPPATQPLCPAGNAAQLLFWDDMEHLDSGNWRAQTLIGRNGWFYPTTDNDDPSKINVRNAASGIHSLWGDNHNERSDSFMALTRDITLPSNAWMAFRHRWDFEMGQSFFTEEDIFYDGGVIEYSQNGGGTWLDANALLNMNGYRDQITDSLDNPLGGRQAFVGSSRGFLLSRLNLSTLAQQNVRFRFRVGTDTIGDHWGWFVDDVMLYTCGPGNTPPFVNAPPARTVQQNGNRHQSVDLWSHTIDMQEPSAALTYTLASTLPISAGITLQDNRFLDIAPLAGFTGSSTVSLLISDTGKLSTTASFRVSVRDDRLVHLPLVMQQEPLELPTEISPVEETTISLLQPDENYCDLATTVAGNRFASLLKFNVSELPPRTVIQQAQLAIFLASSFDTPNKSRTIGLYRVNAPWLSCSVTWNTQPAVAEEFSRLSIPFGSGEWYFFDVTGLAQGWINGQVPNLGLLLKEVGAANQDESYREFLVDPFSDFPPVLTLQYPNGVVASHQLHNNLEATEIERTESERTVVAAPSTGPAPWPSAPSCTTDSDPNTPCLHR